MAARTQPRITLYCELYRFAGGIFFKGVGTGFITSYLNQMKALASRGLPYTEDLGAPADIFQVNSHGPRSFWLIKKFKRRGCKVVVYAHATVEDLVLGFRALHAVGGIMRWYLGRLYRSADAVVCPSSFTARLLTERYGVPQKKTIIISNGVDAAAFISTRERKDQFRKQMGIGADDIIVTNIAMAIPRKGISTFVALAKEFPDVQFAWYGKIFHSFFAKKIPALPSNVRFLGYVEDILHAYAVSDMFLYPSLAENQGISPLEAGAAGLPILLRDMPVYDGLWEDGENCLKASTDDEFKQKLGMLIASAALREKLGGAAHNMVLKEHASSVVAQKLEDLYRTLLNDRESA